MPKVQGAIPNFINGVSQQAPALRLPTQLTRSRNMYPTIIGGLKRRPRASFIKRLNARSDSHWHFVSRDVNERFVAAISSSGVKVFDVFTGAEAVVNAPNGWGYLSSVTSGKDIAALTVADYTYIVNRSVIVTQDLSSATPVRPKEAIVNVAAGNYARTYQIRIDGVVKAEYATPAGDAVAHYPMIATTEIAKRLYEQLVTNLGNDGNPWGVGIHQNALHIIKYTGDFAIAGEDGTNGNSMKIAKDSLSKFSDLPAHGPQDFVIEISNSQGTQFDNMWVQADKGGTNNNSVVKWKEIPKPGSITSLTAGTMPHLLKRNSDGSFTFMPASWDSMKCGDGVNSSPPPSFVGQPLRGIFFHRNRFGVLADEGVVMTRSGSFFDFWRTTTSALLDDDPIDVQAAHIKVSFMRHAIPFKDSLVLFSDDTQFRLTGNELLSPKTVSIRPLTELPCSSEVAPISMGRSVYIVSNPDPGFGFSALTEWAYDGKTDRSENAEATAHCPAYIPSGVHAMAGSMDEGVLALACREVPNRLYVYRYYWSEDQKTQSAWFDWDFEGDVLAIYSVRSRLYVILNGFDGPRLEVINLDTAWADPGRTFAFAIDGAYKLTSNGTFPDANITRFPPVPRRPPGLYGVVVGGAERGVGQTVTVLEATETYTDVRGTFPAGVQMLFGTPIESEAELSRFYFRDQKGVAQATGRLQLLNLELVFDTTSTFEVEVKMEGHPVSTRTYSGPYMDGFVTELVQSPDSGRFIVSLGSRSDTLGITLKSSSPLPAAFITATWRGIWSPQLVRG